MGMGKGDLCDAVKSSAFRSLEFYSSLSTEDALNYDCICIALHKRFNFTEHEYRERFRRAKPESQETPSLFVVRILSYFDK